MKFDKCKAKLKKGSVLSIQSDSTQKLLFCTSSRMLQAVSAFHLTVVLCDLAYVST